MDESTLILRRRLVGLIFGLWMGLLYGIVSETINQLVFRDLPLRFDLQTAFIETLIAMVVGGLLGLLVNLPYHALPGVVLASLSSTVGIVLLGLYGSSGSVEDIFKTLFLYSYLFLPLVALFIPATAILRWASGILALTGEQPGSFWMPRRRAWLAVSMTLIAMLVGSFAIYSSSAQKSLYRMDEIIKNIRADADAPVPFEFQSVLDVVRATDSAYVLEWTDDLSAFPQPLFSEDGNPTAFRLQIVFAYFESGSSVACLFREMDGNLYLCVAGQ